MIRLIVQRHEVRFQEMYDRRDHFTIDVDLPQLEEMLKRGGTGPGGFESWQLLGAELLEPTT